jgi:phosphoribosyl-ATP pyrophosphohydrolase
MLKGLFRSFLEKLNNMAAAASPTTAANEARKRVAEEAVETVMTTAEEAAAKRPRKPKNVKYAMLLSYQGQNYFGMQV